MSILLMKELERSFVGRMTPLEWMGLCFQVRWQQHGQLEQLVLHIVVMERRIVMMEPTLSWIGFLRAKEFDELALAIVDRCFGLH